MSVPKPKPVEPRLAFIAEGKGPNGEPLSNAIVMYLVPCGNHTVLDVWSVLVFVFRDGVGCFALARGIIDSGCIIGARRWHGAKCIYRFHPTCGEVLPEARVIAAA